MSKFEGVRMPNLEPTREIEIVNMGPLYGLSRQLKDAFVGGIKVESDEDLAALAEMRQLNFDYFYEDTQPGAAEDCGDERESTTLVDAMIRPLGPQNMGATSSNALLWGLTKGKKEPHLQIIAGLNAAYHENGIDYCPGGHTAQGAHGTDCGCAAIDLMREVTGVIIDPTKRNALQYLTAALMDPGHFNPEAFDVNIQRFGGLSQRFGSYLQPGYQHATLDLFRKLSPDINPINNRVGKHLGLAVIANRVKGTRLNQDLLATVRNNKRPFEAFGVDVWYAYDLSEKLFSNPGAQQEFVTGRTMYDAAALLAITDGSLDLMVRT